MASEEEEEGADDGSVMMMTVVDNCPRDNLIQSWGKNGLKSSIDNIIGRKKNFRPTQDSKWVKQRKFRKLIA